MARRRRLKGDHRSTVRRDVPLSSRRLSRRDLTAVNYYGRKSDYRAANYNAARTPFRYLPSKPPLQIQVLKSGPDQNYPRVVLAPWAQSVSAVKRGALVCGRRQIRREVLFANKISGRNLRRSPGRGGAYRRTEGSNITCSKRY